MSQPALVEKAFVAFRMEATNVPTLTLRAGNALDEDAAPPPIGPVIDAISDEYLERYPWGIGYLDPESWRHYLPYLVSYANNHLHEESDVVDSFVNSLRPPDREPPRLSVLSSEQQEVIMEFLDLLAFSSASAHQDLACQALEEWWAPGALYRMATE